jgi:hypothetical protein
MIEINNVPAAVLPLFSPQAQFLSSEWKLSLAPLLQLSALCPANFIWFNSNIIINKKNDKLQRKAKQS